MSSFTKHNNSPEMDKTWFQDTKTSCEKQAHYFVQIRKLQDELIHREQHNLINAMERLKQITYPRKRPMIRNVVPNPSSDNSSVQSFPARSLNLRKEAKHKAIQGKEQTELKPLSGKPLISKPSHKKQDQSHFHHFFVMPPLLTDRDIAKIVHNANTTFPTEPSTYLLQPHLPSIPNVGRKTTFMVDNRLKLLTLAESEFCDQEEGSISGMRKQLHTGKSRQRKKSSKSKSQVDEHVSSSENINSRSKRNVLTFDVDPNDPSLFSHCVEDRKEEQFDETTPLPPPNSRPSSAKSRASREGDRIQGVNQKDTPKGTDSSANKDTEVPKTTEGNIPVTEVEKPSMDPEVNITGNNGISEGHGLSSHLTEAKSTKQDGSDLVNNSEETANIVEPVVTISSKPAPIGEDEIDHEK